MAGPQQKDEPIVTKEQSSIASLPHNKGASGAQSCSHVCLIKSPTQADVNLLCWDCSSTMGSAGVFPQEDHKPSCPSRSGVWDAATAAARDLDGGQASLNAAPYSVPISEACHIHPKHPCPHRSLSFYTKKEKPPTATNQTTKYSVCVGVTHHQAFTPQMWSTPCSTSSSLTNQTCPPPTSLGNQDSTVLLL